MNIAPRYSIQRVEKGVVVRIKDISIRTLWLLVWKCDFSLSPSEAERSNIPYLKKVYYTYMYAFVHWNDPYALCKAAVLVLKTRSLKGGAHFAQNFIVIADAFLMASQVAHENHFRFNSSFSSPAHEGVINLLQSPPLSEYQVEIWRLA